MKKIYSIIGLSSLLFLSVSCQDWLDMPSESKADSSSVFSTIGRAEMTVVGAYPSLHTQELGYQLLEGTDECASNESNSKYNVSNYDYTNLTGMLSNTYTTMYKAIEYSNVCIKNIPNMSASSAADQKKIDGLLGEALAIRAYAYWNLVRFYGDVPFTEVPTSELSTFASSRVSRDTIYDHCIRDLKRACELLPWKSESYVSTPERFTKNAAYGILARVAMYAAGYSLRWDLTTVPYSASTVRIAQRDDAARIRELYQIAADACYAVINRNENELIDDYDQLFRNLANQQYNKETMLEYGWYGKNSPDVRTGYTNGIPWSGTSSVLGKGGSQMFAFPTLLFEFEDGDQRRDVSVCNYGISSGKPDTYRMETYIGMGVGKYRINWKKERGSTDSRRDINWPLLRYSEVLLTYAEALNELHHGATTEAVAAVKEVRMRAFRNDETKIGSIPTDYEGFRNFLIKERKLELNNEGLRRTDLTRWGIQYEHLMNEKAKLVKLAKREAPYDNLTVYRAYKQPGTPCFEDPTIGIEFIPMKEQDLIDKVGLSEDDLATIHILNSGSKGAVNVDFYEVGDEVYYKESDVPAGAKANKVQYTILNMYSINSIKQKGNMSVEDVEGISSNNPWITGATGVFYGLEKNKTELMPFNTTNIIDVNPGLAGQQHPCY